MDTREGTNCSGLACPLPDQDADLAAQLSDLSGMPVEERTPSYLTCYPLPSGTHYAIAGTWMDDEAPRDGCVLTHTLLVPMAEWLSGLSARALVATLRKPRLPLREFPGRPMRLGTVEVGQDGPERGSSALSTSALFGDFVIAYFGRGRRPSVWLDGPPNGDLASLLLDFVWPSLRRDITLCTYALKPRSILGRPFDVQFAPRSAARRFSKIPERNIIGLSSKPGPEPSGRDARLISSISDDLIALDRHEVTRRWSVYARLQEKLPRDPDAPMRLVVLEEMREKAEASPTAAVAVLDALAAILPAMDDGLLDKGTALEAALIQALTQPPAFAVELLGAVADRCSKLAFRRFSGKRRQIIGHITRLVALDPLGCLFTVSRTKGRHLSLMTGVAAGLAAGDGDGAVHLDRLEAVRPDVVDTLLRLRPELITLYLRVHAALAVESAAEAERRVIAWLRRSTDARRRTLAKAIARSSPPPLAAPVLIEVAPNLARTDLRHLFLVILDATMSDVDRSRTDAIWPMLDRMTDAYPVDVRDAVSTFGLTSPRIARLWAESFTDPQEGLKGLAGLNPARPCARVWALAALFDMRGRDLLGSSLVADSASWIAEILRNRCAHGSPEVSRLLCALLERSDNKDLILHLSPYDREDGALDARTSSLLAGVLAESLIVTFCSGQIDHARMCAWVGGETLANSIRTLDPSKVIGNWEVARRRVVDQEVWAIRVWQWLGETANIPKGRRDWVAIELVDWAFAHTANAWDPGMTALWVDVVKSSRHDAEQEWVGPIEVHAINSAMTHGHLPLSALLVTSFPRFYKLVLHDQAAFPLLTLWFPDWDKAKQLRKRLVSTFLDSRWPAGDLALAADGAGILDRVVSRLRRKGHEHYLMAMISDLRRRPGKWEQEIAWKVDRLGSENTLSWD